MRHARATITAGLFASSLLAAGSAAIAQQPFGEPQAFQPAPEIYIPPFVWNGNALDQKILDAQAQMIVPRHASARPQQRRHPH